MLNSFAKRLQNLGTFNMWRKITNFWCLIFFVAIVYDFLNNNYLSNNEILLAIAAIYCATLAIYSAEKEFRRWHHMHESIHPGEIYAIVWTILVIGIVVSSIIFRLPYHMPPEVSASYIAVISILALTRESKSYYKSKKEKS